MIVTLDLSPRKNAIYYLSKDACDLSGVVIIQTQYK